MPLVRSAVPSSSRYHMFDITSLSLYDIDCGRSTSDVWVEPQYVKMIVQNCQMSHWGKYRCPSTEKIMTSEVQYRLPPSCTLWDFLTYFPDIIEDISECDLQGALYRTTSIYMVNFSRASIWNSTATGFEVGDTKTSFSCEE